MASKPQRYAQDQEISRRCVADVHRLPGLRIETWATRVLLATASNAIIIGFNDIKEGDLIEAFSTEKFGRRSGRADLRQSIRFSFAADAP
jgi:hypothetical protein